MVKISAQKCLMCGDSIYSRAGHDFHYCYCGNIYVDGGPSFIGEESYSRVGYSFDELYESKFISLDIDEQEAKTILRRDWSQGIDKYGWQGDDDYTDEIRMAAKAKIKLLEKK